MGRKVAICCALALAMTAGACTSGSKSGPGPDTTFTTSAPDTTSTTSITDKLNKKLDEILGQQKAQPASRALQPPSSLSYGTEATPTNLGQYLESIVQDVATYWNDTFTANGHQWTTVHYKILYDEQTAIENCVRSDGKSQIAGDPDLLQGVNPANYCPADNTVYLSVQWIYDKVWQRHADQQRAGQDFGVAAVVAHELGHTVQTYLGIEKAADAPTVESLELQADCLAGVWANAKYYQGVLEGGDVEVAAEDFSYVGDYEFFSPGHHGTPDQRQRAFMLGYNSGQGADCTSDLGDGL